LLQKTQLELTPRRPNLDHPGWGGAREGAGRPRSSKGVPHAKRPAHKASHPVHVTLRVSPEVGTLRTKTRVKAIRAAMRAAHEKRGDQMRVVQFSVQSTHVHLIVEAKDKAALSSGMKGFQVRVAKKLNKIAGRKGTVFTDRFHAHTLRTPSEVRHAYAYVLLNSRHHTGRPSPEAFIDPCSSGFFFQGWRYRPPLPPSHLENGDEESTPPVAPPNTWLAREGWHHEGRKLIAPDEVPGG